MRQYHEGVLDDGGLPCHTATVATCLSNELSVDDRAIERLLHHTSQDVTRQRYNRGWPGVLECQARTLREPGPPD
jgi:integrase